MADRDGFSVYLIPGERGAVFLGDVKAELMAKEIKIDPMFGLAPDGAPQAVCIEGARRLFIINRRGEVEGTQTHGGNALPLRAVSVFAAALEALLVGLQRVHLIHERAAGVIAF